MIFNKKKDENEANFVKIGALLIHAAKIDENYSVYQILQKKLKILMIMTKLRQ